ncbi:MAG: penicillin acylase family protein [Thermoanaerobaculia bacterium]|jgi:penicillin amidase
MRRIAFALLLSFCVVIPLAAQTGTWVKYPGMRAAGQVTRDANGIAYIRGLTDYDAVFLNGYVHAEDRLFQMDENRRTASGTLAELLGSAALPSDVQLRTLGIRRGAQLTELESSPRLRELMSAYAAGVNYWVSTHSLPAEYAAIEITKFQPWTTTDSFAVAKLLAFGLSFELDIDNTVAYLTYVGAGKVAGFDGAKLFSEDLFRAAPFDPASTIPDATAGTGKGLGLIESTDGFDWSASTAASEAATFDPAAVELAKNWVGELRTIPFFQQVLDPDNRGGSNEWAFAGKLTATGRPLIANDPHLSLRMPSTFYPLSLRGSRLNAAGVGFPGAPLVVQGHTDRVAWGSTVHPLDVTDVYQEQVVPDATAPAGLSALYKGQKVPLFPVLQTFRINNPGNGTPDDLVVVPPSASIPQATLLIWRRNSPIISLNLATGAAVSVQWVGHGPTRELETFLIWNEAKNLADFKRGLEYFDVGSQNFVYGDIDGNIAYLTGGEAPIREDLQAGTITGAPPFFMRNGQGGNDWIPVTSRPATQASSFQILTAAEMPHLENPASGWFVNANNDPVGTSLDNNSLNQLRPGGGIYYLNAGYSGFRAGRITQMVREKLQANEKFTVADIKRMQADVTLIDAQFFVPHITEALGNGQASQNPALLGLASQPAIQAAVGRLAAWNFTAPTGIAEGYDSADVNGALSAPSQAEIDASVAATIYSVWRGQFIKNTIDPVLSAGPLPAPGSAAVVTALRNLLENYDTNHGVGASGLPFFNVPGIPNTAETAADRRDILILKSIADAMGLITSDAFAPAFNKSADMSDWRWGKLHRIVFSHPLGGPFNAPTAGGAFPAPLAGLKGIPVDGGFEVPDASSHNSRASTLDGFMFAAGPNRRMATELTTTAPKAETSLPGGISGILTSPLYVNLLKPYLTNDTFPIDVPSAPPVVPWGVK